jgi:adenosylcobinamide-phosphate synthase
MFHTAALGIGILLDLLIGDPHALPHPVRAIGRLISFLEERLYDPGKGMVESRKEMNDPRKVKERGTILWVTVVATVMLVTGLLLSAAYLLSPYAGVAVEAICSAYALAARSLCKESMKVAAALKAGDLPGARRALSMIVGRDTDRLPEDEVIKAAVETVAENTSDGVIAPFLYLALGGGAK